MEIPLLVRHSPSPPGMPLSPPHHPPTDTHTPAQPHPTPRWFGIPSYYVQRLFRQVQGTAYLGTQVTVNPDTEVGGVQGTACLGTACLGTAHMGTAYLGTQVSVHPAREVGDAGYCLVCVCRLTINSVEAKPCRPQAHEDRVAASAARHKGRPPRTCSKVCPPCLLTSHPHATPLLAFGACGQGEA